MIETTITQSGTAPAPEDFLALVVQANDLLKTLVESSNLAYQATWQVRGGLVPQASLKLTCLNGSRTIELSEPQLRAKKSLERTLEKLRWDILGLASAALGRDIDRRLAALAVEDE